MTLYTYDSTKYANEWKISRKKEIIGVPHIEKYTVRLSKGRVGVERFHFFLSKPVKVNWPFEIIKLNFVFFHINRRGMTCLQTKLYK